MARRKGKRRILRKRAVKKDCVFCKQDVEPDYKDVDNLSKFVSERGRIYPKSQTGICHKHQRKLGREIKRARFLSLLPYVVRPS